MHKTTDQHLVKSDSSNTQTSVDNNITRTDSSTTGTEKSTYTRKTIIDYDTTHYPVYIPGNPIPINATPTRIEIDESGSTEKYYQTLLSRYDSLFAAMQQASEMQNTDEVKQTDKQTKRFSLSTVVLIIGLVALLMVYIEIKLKFHSISKVINNDKTTA